MPDEPYRYAKPPQEDELARLAQQGQSRIAAASHDRSQTARVEEGRHLRIAIGSVRGSLLRRILLVPAILGAVSVIGVVALVIATNDPSYMTYFAPAFVPAILFFMLYMFLAPVATLGQVAAERQWVASLPFRLEGYFETLSGEPQAFARVGVVLEYQSVGPDQQTFQGIIGNLDTEARVQQWHPERAGFQSGQISSFTGIRVNRVSVYRNHKLAKYLRRLVGEVLLPLHRSRPLSRVTIARS